MELGLGYITGYNPENATVDIRTANGTQYPAVPFDSSLAVYATPVLPILQTQNDVTTAVKIGSFVLYARFSDKDLRIIRIFNDDQDIIENFPGHTTRMVHGTIRDTLLAMMQDGELLMMAPGRIIETTSDVFERQMGSWMLLKNSGDAILSNADSSCEVFVSHSGPFEVTATKHRIIGSDTRVEEDDAGTLIAESGASRGTPVSLSLMKDGMAQLISGASSLSMTPTGMNMAAGDISISGGNTVTVDTATLEIVAKVVEIDAEGITLAAHNTALITADNVGLYASTNVGITADGAVNILAGTTAGITAISAIDVAAKNVGIAADETLNLKFGQGQIVLGSTGAQIVLNEDAKLVITIGDTTIEVSTSGVNIAPPAGTGTVIVGPTASAQSVLYGTPANPLASTVLKVGA